MSSAVDLRALAGERKEPVSSSRRPGHFFTRYVLPGLFLLGFLALVGWAARDSFLPARAVTVVPVLTSRSDVLQQAGAPLFLAAGWIEPRPTPVLVTALAEGIVEQLLVVEGQPVKAGEPVARLVDADARLAVAAAEADQRQKEAEADTLVAKTEAELLFLPFQIQSAEAQHRLARIDLERKKAAVASIPEVALLHAEAALTVATAKIEELRVRKQRLDREVVSLKQMREAFRNGEEWQSAQALTDTEASMKTAMIRVRQAQLAVDTARLRLERMIVRAPISGRVLALVARPGSRLMGQAQHAMQDSSTVVSLYNPAMLQIRADVRFEDLPNLVPGQPVRIESPALPGKPVEGEVLFATSVADIQKNTLQVKVAIKEPPPVLKPDMLVQVTFLAGQPDVNTAAAETLRLLVPRSLVNTGEGGTRVWLADQSAGLARLRSIKLGRAALGDLIEVTDGLTPADKLISGGRDGLADGQRIKVTGEEASLGTSMSPGAGKTGKPQRLPGKHSTPH